MKMPTLKFLGDDFPGFIDGIQNRSSDDSKKEI